MKEIVLSNRNITIVDDENYKELIQFNWHERRSGEHKYAIRRYTISKYKYGSYPMHHIILKLPLKIWIDHKNGNGLDNRRSNLRICTPQQNQYNRKIQKNNTSGFKGVWKDGKKWRAGLKIERKMHYLGFFDIVEEGAKAYDDMVIKIRGEFALTNKQLGLLN